MTHFVLVNGRLRETEYSGSISFVAKNYGLNFGLVSRVTEERN